MVWLDVHKDSDDFSQETVSSPSKDRVSQLRNHRTSQFLALERAPQPLKHFQGMLPAGFTAEQLDETRNRRRTDNRCIARSIQPRDEKALVSVIQELEGWSDAITENRRAWCQAVWHAAHESQLTSATASAALAVFRPGMLAQLGAPQPSPMSEIVIIRAHHNSKWGDMAVEQDRPKTVRLRVSLEDYEDTYSRT